MDASPLSHWISSGDLRRAGEWLVRTHASDVAALCAAMLRDPQAAEDVAQEVFSRAFDSLASFRGEASPRTWLLAIARHRCIDYLRAQKRDPWANAHDGNAEPDAHADVAPLPAELLVRRGDVEAALAALGEGERALVVLRYRNGLDFRELAQAFGLREGAVRMRLSRALGRMRAALEVAEAPSAAPAGAARPSAPRAVPPAAAALLGPPPPAPRGPMRARAPGPLPQARSAPPPVPDPFRAALACSYDASPALTARLAMLVASLPSR